MKLETKRPKKSSVYACFALLGFLVYGIEASMGIRGLLFWFITVGFFMLLASLYYKHFDEKFDEEELRSSSDMRVLNKNTMFGFLLMDPCEAADFSIYGKTENDLAVKDIRNGRYDKAIIRLEPYLKKKPELTGAWINLGLSYGATKRYEDARTTFLWLQKVGVRKPQVLQGLALSEFLMGQYQASLEACQKYDETYRDGKLLKLQECCQINLRNNATTGAQPSIVEQEITMSQHGTEDTDANIKPVLRLENTEEKTKKRSVAKLVAIIALGAVLTVVAVVLIFPIVRDKYYIIKYGKDKYDVVKNLQVGDFYTFGTYELDGNEGNGKEPIEWIVVKKDGMKVQLCCKSIVDYRAYHDSKKDNNIFWETSTIRTWLNKEFYKEAFYPEEQRKVIKTKLDNEGNSKYGTKGGNATKDRVYIFSESELYDLVDADIINESYPYSDYDTKREKEKGGYWLRTPGKRQSNVLVYLGDEKIDSTIPGYELYGVRPVIWVDLSK